MNKIYDFYLSMHYSFSNNCKDLGTAVSTFFNTFKPSEKLKKYLKMSKARDYNVKWKNTLI